MQRVPGRAPPKSDADSNDETYRNLLSSQRRLLDQLSAAGLSMDSFRGQRNPNERRNDAIGGELSHKRMSHFISETPASEFSYNKSSSTGPDSFVDPPKSDADSKDESYLNHLSCEQQLLNQLSSAGLSTVSFSGQRSPNERRNDAIRGELSHNRMNRSISEPPSTEFPYNKISSIGPDRHVDQVSSSPCYSMPVFETKQSWSEIGIDIDAKVTKPPTLGLSLSFLDNPLSRRGSTVSHREDVHLFDTDGRLDDDDDEDDVDFMSIEPLEFKYEQEPALLVKELTSFDGAMAKSQQSQQRIHDWDKKMGLKRSHSKTMRLTSRSRKKIRVLLKRELTSLSHQNSSTSREGG